MGVLFQDGLTGSALGDWAKSADLRLRAFESELGVPAPFGFRNPLGYTTDGDEEVFERRRASVARPGRISMLATKGYLTPERAGKSPGNLSDTAKRRGLDNHCASAARLAFLRAEKQPLQATFAGHV